LTTPIVGGRYHAVDLPDFDLARLAKDNYQDPSLGLKRSNWVVATCQHQQGHCYLYGFDNDLRFANFTLIDSLLYCYFR
jgi:hypothetical protein